MDQQNAEQALADLKGRMNHWRTTFPRTQQLPIFLWEDAADLLPYFPIDHMAKELRQSPMKLKQKILEYHERLMAGETKSHIVDPIVKTESAES